MGCGNSKSVASLQKELAAEQARKETLERRLADESVPEGVKSSARRFAHQYVKALSIPKGKGIFRPGRVQTLELEAEGQEHGFPRGGLSALQRQEGEEGLVKALPEELVRAVDALGRRGEEKVAWWHDLKKPENGVATKNLEGNEVRSLASSYYAHFQDQPPRYRPALREIARKHAEEKAAAAAAAETKVPAARAAIVQEVAAKADCKENRFGIGHAPKNLVPKTKQSAKAGGLEEQTDGVMRLEDESTDDVTVVARVRPFLPVDSSDNMGPLEGLIVEHSSIQIKSSDLENPGRPKTFDAVIGQTNGSDEVFDRTGMPAAKEVTRGVSAVVFAFGQTGSGKTYTLLGGIGKDGVKSKGIASMSYEELSSALKLRADQESKSKTVKYTVECSILQVYLGGVYDLLGKDPEAQLRMRSHDREKTLKDAGGEECLLSPKETILPCRNAEEFSKLLEKGIGKRAVRGTLMNATSSRSHCIITLFVKRELRLKSHTTEGQEASKYMSRLVLVDLAGNERDSARQGADDEAQLRAEGIDVNKSLTALSSVLRMRSRGEPVGGASRSSALTRLLKEPLTSAKIFFIACVSPTKAAAHTSAQTLGYAALVKKIKTNAEDSAKLLEVGLNRFPIEFISHTKLIERGAIARSSDRMTVYLNELRAAVVKVFVSHRWLSPRQRQPDIVDGPPGNHHPKHKLICGAIDRMIEQGWIRSSDMIVDWIDFTCINQDSSNPAKQLNGSMGRIIGSCDVMLTPIYDPDWKTWDPSCGGCTIMDAFTDYRASPFQDYIRRGWCRLEMFFNANVPFDTGRAQHFNGKLYDVMTKERRRPHLIFGTREADLGLEPILLPHLQDDKFALYHPVEGQLFQEKDRDVIRNCVDELFKINSNLKNLEVKSTAGAISARVTKNMLKMGDKCTTEDMPEELRKRYEPGEVIGKGGFTTVVEITHKSSRIQYALKMIASESESGFDVKTTKRLQREAGMLREVDSPHVVGINEEGFTDDYRLFFMVMELLKGEPLDVRIDKRDYMTESEAAIAGMHVIRGLVEIHKKGVIHRDIKPGNIICTPDETQQGGKKYTIIDLGIAVAVEGGGAKTAMKTTTATFAGTLQYCSPEMITQHLNGGGMAPLGFHVDLWALGVTLFQLTTGKLPFDNITDIPDARKPAKDVLDELAEDRRAGFSTHFSKILARSMTKKRAERYDAAEIMLEDLHQCLVARGESMYSVFISYRVFSEAKMAHLLFKVLSNSQTADGHRVTVYLDHKRLEDGEPWEKGFCDGLLNSILFVPLISNRGVTDKIGNLKGGDADWPDNVLKELQLAVALMEVDEKRKAGGYTEEEDPKGNGKLKGILPLLVNDQANKGEEGYPCMKQFDFSKLNFVDQVSNATTTAVVGFLKDNQVPVPEAAPTRTVKATMDTIMKTQGIQVAAHNPGLKPVAVKSTQSFKVDTEKEEQFAMLMAELMNIRLRIHDRIDMALSGLVDESRGSRVTGTRIPDQPLDLPQKTTLGPSTSIGNAEDLVTPTGYAAVSHPTPGLSFGAVPEQNVSTSELDALIQTVETLPDVGIEDNSNLAKEGTQMLRHHQESAGQLLRDLDQEIPETNLSEKIPS